AVVCETLPVTVQDNITYVTVKSRSQALGIIASNFYGNLSESVKLVGVTGTNGKTTTATLLFRLFTALGYKCGLISTVENIVVDQVVPATHTTPDPIQLNELLSKMTGAGCTHVFMEVSSHAID